MTVNDPRHAGLADRLEGRVITPEASAYDQARTLFYGGFDRRPSLIVHPGGADDVAQVVAHAAETGVELAVRSGGHSLAGHSVTEGGIVLDLSGMKGLDIDPGSGTAWAEAGLTAGEYTEATGRHGLATGFGDTGSVGIGGITLAGGIGLLSRRHGLTIDGLLGAELVTADGRVVEVDDEHHPDLFWAIRGGGGNFGVATRFKYRLQAVDMVVGGILVLPAESEVVQGLLAAAAEAPRELTAITNVMMAPPLPFLPEAAHGKLVVMVIVTHTGPAEAGDRAVAPFRAVAPPIADMIGPRPYPEMFPPEQEGFHPVAAGRNMFVDAVDVAATDVIIDQVRASTAMMAATQIRVLGGAISDVPEEATAFAHRRRSLMVNVGAVFADPAEMEVHQAWVDRLSGVLSPTDDGAYVGFLGPDGPRRIGSAYPPATLQRLRAVKAAYDPDNLFRLNHNIAPGGG